MSMKILISGLNEIGGSLSLALSGIEADLVITGYDRNSKKARDSRKMKIIDRIVFNPDKVARDADMIFLCVPPSEVIEYLEYFKPLLKKDAIVFDTSALKFNAVQWAQDHMPEERYYIGMVPVVNPNVLHQSVLEHAVPKADYFRGGVMTLAIPARTPEQILNLTLKIIELLESEPFFVDPAEVDAITAWVEGMPAIVAAAAMRVVANSPGWRETQRMVGRSFATTAMPSIFQDPENSSATMLLNRSNMILRLDALIDELQHFRGLLNEEDSLTLTENLEEASEHLNQWLLARRDGSWGGTEMKKPSIPEGGMLDRLFGIGPLRKKEKE
jgi:prephenate dehydrogenase